MPINAFRLVACVCALTTAVFADDHDHKPAATRPAAHDHDHDEHDHGHAPAATRPAGHDHGHPPGENKPHDHDHDGHDAHTDEVRLSADAVKRNGIRTAPAGVRAIALSFVAPARIAFDADAMAHVGSAVIGRVAEVRAKVGDTVKAGDVLLRVESPEVAKAQSEFVQRRTEAAVAADAVGPLKDQLERGRKLLADDQGLTLPEVQKREADYRAAVGAASVSRAAATAAENALRLLGFADAQVTSLADGGTINGRYAVRAPIDGRVIEREVTLGEGVSPGKDRLMVIADTGRVWALADVPEARLPGVKVGGSVRIALAAPNAAVHGEIALIGHEIDAATHTARVRVVLPNADGSLRPGMFARATLTAGDTAETLAVPEAAVLMVEGKPAVFVPVAGEPNTFAKREVTPGPAAGGYVPITSGLKAGEAVVVSGAFLLKAELGKSSAGHEH